MKIFPTRLAWCSLLACLSANTACATAHEVHKLDDTTIHTFRRDYANAHLVVRGPNAFLFDTGLTKNAAKLAEDIREAGVDPHTLRAVVLSHGHADHAGGAAYFKRTFGTKVVAGKADRAMLARGSNDHLCPTENTSRVQEDQAATFEPFTADVEVESEQPLASLAGIDGRIVPLPGHTEGSLVVIVGASTLVGDLFRGSILGSSAELHFYMCDLEDNRKDIQQLLGNLTPAGTTFFTGHFGPVSREAVARRFLPPSAPQ